MPLADRAAEHRVAGLQEELRLSPEKANAETPLREGRHPVPGVPVGVPDARSHSGRNKSRRQ